MAFISKKALKSTKLVNGRILLWNADDSIKNMKKACPFAQEYLDDANKPIVSGDSVTEDVVKSFWWHVEGVKEHKAGCSGWLLSRDMFLPKTKKNQVEFQYCCWGGQWNQQPLRWWWKWRRRYFHKYSRGCQEYLWSHESLQARELVFHWIFGLCIIFSFQRKEWHQASSWFCMIWQRSSEQEWEKL